MHPPDVDTLRLCSILASTAFGVVFTTLWLRSRSDLHFALWGLSSLIYASIILAFALMAAPSQFVVTILFSIFGLTDILAVAGVRLLDDRRPFARWMALPVACPALGHGVPAALASLGWIEANGLWQAVGDASGLALAMGMCGIALAFDKGTGHSSGRRMAGMALLGYLPAYAGSIVVTVWAVPGGEWVALLAMLSDQVLLGILNLGLLAIPIEQVQRQLRDTALRDPLTGTWNRAGLDQMSERFSLPGATAVALDVDHFKTINDRFGHAAGDEVLVIIGHEARALAGDFLGQVARLGGDEFVVLLPPGQDARAFAEMLDARLRTAGGDGSGWSVSMGIGDVPAEAMPAGDASLIGAIRRADEALYEAKARGRSRIAA